MKSYNYNPEAYAVYIDFLHSDILSGLMSEGFKSSVMDNLSPKLLAKYGECDIQFYEDYIKDGFVLDKDFYYPITIIVNSSPRTQWIKWEKNNNFENGIPYAYVGMGEIDFTLVDTAPFGFAEQLKGRMSYAKNDTVEFKISSVSADKTFLCGKASQTFIDMLKKALTSELEEKMLVKGVKDSSLEVRMMFAPESYMEHTTNNVTYRRLLIGSAGSAARDLWIKWTRLDSDKEGYSVSDNPLPGTISFEIADNVPQKVREREYRFLVRVDVTKYHNSMGRKNITEWREVLKRLVKKGELTKVSLEELKKTDSAEFELPVFDARTPDNEPAPDVDVPAVESVADETIDAAKSAEGEDDNSGLDKVSAMLNDVLKRYAVEDTEPKEEPEAEEESETDSEFERAMRVARLAVMGEVQGEEDYATVTDTLEVDLGTDSEDTIDFTTIPSSEEYGIIDTFFDDTEDESEVENEAESEAEDEDDLPPFDIDDAPVSNEPIIEEEPVLALTKEDEMIIEEPTLDDNLFTAPTVDEPKQEQNEVDTPEYIEAETISIFDIIDKEQSYTPAPKEDTSEINKIHEKLLYEETLEKEVAERVAIATASLRLEIQRLKQENEQLKSHNDYIKDEYEIKLKAAENQVIKLKNAIDLKNREEEREILRAQDAARLAILNRQKLEEEARARKYEEAEAILREKREEEERQKRLELEREKKRVEEERARIEKEALEYQQKTFEFEPEPEEEPERKGGFSIEAEPVLPKYTYEQRLVRIMFRQPADPNILSRISEIMNKTVEYFNKSDVYIRVKASMPDPQTALLNFVEIPKEEMELLVNIIKVLGKSGLNIAKIVLE